MNRLAITTAAALLAALAACASNYPVSDLRGKDVAAADTAPSVKPFPEKSPGGAQVLIPRTFTGQPPLVPHAIARYEPITVEQNDCLDCHISDELNGKKMPRMGDNHFVPPGPGGGGNPVVDMARYECTTCHVQQVDAPPLIENDFVGWRKKR